MLDPVVIPTLYFLAIFQLVLQAGVFIYAYRVTKITGSFRAWTLIIVAFAILTIQNAVGILLELTLPSSQISSLIESVGVETTFLSISVNLAASLALFLGFFGLFKRFQAQPKNP